MASYNSSDKSSPKIISEKEANEKYKCDICLNILDKSCRLNVCTHIFCRSCIYNAYQQAKHCPVCRKPGNFSDSVVDKQLDEEIRNLAIKCEYCPQTVPLKSLQNHRMLCNESITPKATSSQQTSNGSRFSQRSMISSINSSLPMTSSASKVPPNRYTFKCPYCDEANLTVDTLLDHCNKNHKDEPKRVVCPICKAMPWGDSNQVSTNFITHINMRHKFEYDRYVDFSMDEDEALAKALRESLSVK